MLAILMAATLTAATTPEGLAGDWTVDLTSSKSATPYLKRMSLTLADDGAVTGSFYDSDIQAGRWQTSKGRTCVSFRTTDGKGPYHTAACLEAGRLTGQTWAEHRGFVFVWNATRTEPVKP